MEPYHEAYFIRHHLVGAGLHELAQKVRSLTKEDAMKDYENLKKQRPGTNLMGRIGNRAMDYYFFEKRLDTGSKRGDNEAFPAFFARKGWNDAPSYQRLYKMGTDAGQSPERSAYSVFSLYWGAINAFKPIVARMLYDKFNAHTVLDFSAGWGGRALAAMSLDINYIGFDTNTDLRKPYEQMIKDFPHKSNVKVYFQDSAKVDYSKFDYDMVFTSPPYYLKTKPTEAYKNMPKYADRAEFNEKFLFPVVRKTYEHLKTGGHYCLNIPMDMYDDIIAVLGRANSKILLPKVSRGGSAKGSYKEYIYIWNKGAKTLKGAGGGGLVGGGNIMTTFNNIANAVDDFILRNTLQRYRPFEISEREPAKNDAKWAMLQAWDAGATPAQMYQDAYDVLFDKYPRVTRRELLNACDSAKRDMDRVAARFRADQAAAQQAVQAAANAAAQQAAQAAANAAADQADAERRGLLELIRQARDGLDSHDKGVAARQQNVIRNRPKAQKMPKPDIRRH
jgi:hypothetical protein